MSRREQKKLRRFSMRCEICDFSRTAPSNLQQSLPRQTNNQSRVQYYKPLKKYLCSECIQKERENVVANRELDLVDGEIETIEPEVEVVDLYPYEHTNLEVDPNE